MNKGKIKYVFTSSHTKTGFHTFIPELMANLRQVYILKGAAGAGKSTFIRLLGETMCEHGYEIEFWISAIDPLNPDGVYIAQLDVAVVNGSLPIPIDPFYPGGIGEIINLGELLDKVSIQNNRSEIQKLVEEVRKREIKSQALLKQAGIVKQEIKQVTSKYLNLEKVKMLINDLTNEILADEPREKHYFASALTADGMINYIDDISAGCLKRYLFKGPAGSAKSTIISELANIFREKGFIIEYYHSGFDIDSLDMIIICNLQVALIDGGNIELSVRPWDVVIDMNTFLDNYEMESASIIKSENYRNFESLILEIQSELDSMRNSLKSLKKVYAAAADFEKLDEKRQELRQEILKI